MSKPQQHGFYITEDQKYAPQDEYYNVQVDKTVPSWQAFASQYGLSYRLLEIYNPWLRDNKLTVKKNVYQIRIPKNKSE